MLFFCKTVRVRVAIPLQPAMVVQLVQPWNTQSWGTQLPQGCIVQDSRTISVPSQTCDSVGKGACRSSVVGAVWAPVPGVMAASSKKERHICVTLRCIAGCRFLC
mmetsp:Transcript_131852/g.214704  ORF Transcript_131852/g.214704 Transcript_131852/m.214704 type:complete len:105 (-) Transcript_131852:15-329(-)